MRRAYLAALAILLASAALAQSPRENYSLLWEISGNGLEQSSYLFGTMHLAEPAVFDFSDSVLVALDRCERFALEVHPDSIVARMFQSLNSADSTNEIREQLSPDEYDRLNARLLKRKGVSLDQLANKKPWAVRMLLKEEEDSRQKAGDVFLDAYLFRLARNQGKVITGLEPLENQIDALEGRAPDLKELAKEDPSDESPNQAEVAKARQAAGTARMDHLVKLYHEGDIEAIGTFVLGPRKGTHREEILRKRNNDMAHSMDSLMAIGSLFSAVGAAHLPGADGLISLLRKQGYAVNPVKATFSGDAANYEEVVRLMPWYSFSQPALGYEIEMPSAPVALDISDAYSMHFYPDLGTGMIYNAFSVTSGASTEEAEDDAMKQLRKRMNRSSNGKVLRSKRIEHLGRKGQEVIQETDGGVVRMWLFAHDGQVTVAMVGVTEEQIHSVSANRFLSSLRFVPKQRSPELSKWQVLTHEEGAFTTLVPTAMEYVFSEPEAEIEGALGSHKVHLWKKSDMRSANLYLLRYNNAPRGIVMNSDSLFVDEMSTAIASRYQTEPEYVKEITKEGYPGFEMKLAANGINVWYQLYLRGHRTYLLAVQELVPRDGKPNPEVGHYFDSFRFLAHKEAALTTVNADTSLFIASWPEQPGITYDSTATYLMPEYVHSANNIALHEPTGDVYMVDRSVLNPYYRAESHDSLFSTWRLGYELEYDTLQQETVLTVDGFPARDWVFASQNSGQHTRTRTILHGNVVYSVVFSGSMEGASKSNGKAFIESFHFTSPPKGDLLTPKGLALLAALQGTDTTERNLASDMVYSHEFLEEEYPAFLAAVQQPWPDDTLTYYSTRSRLLMHASEVPMATIAPEIQAIYESCWEYPHLQYQAIKALMDRDSLEGLSKALELLQRSPPAELRGWQYESLFAPPRWRTPNGIERFSELVPLLSTEGLEQSVLAAAEAIVNTDSLDGAFLKPHQSELFAARDRLLAHLDAREADTLATRLAWLCGSFNTLLPELDRDPESIRFLKVLEADGNRYQQAQAAVALIRMDQEVETATWKAIFADDWTAIVCLQELVRFNALGSAPGKYLKQKKLAKRLLHKALEDFEDYADEISIEGSTVTEWEGKQCRVYFAKISYYWKNQETGAKEQAHYLGFSGPWPLDGSVGALSEDLSGTSWATFSGKDMEAQLQAFIEELQREY